MRKHILLICFIVFFSCFIFLSKSLKAEDFDYEKAYQDFAYNLSLYDISFNEYKDARAQYLQFKTLTSKETAKEKTLKLLQVRDETVKTYLTSVRMKIRESRGLDDSQKNAYYVRLDEEINFFEDHKDKLASAGTLEDLVKDSDEAKERYESSTKIVIYSSLIGIATGKTAFIRGEIEKTLSELKTKISEIRQNGDKDVSTIERSIADLENKIARSKDKDSQAKNIIGSIKNTERDKGGVFDEALLGVQSSYLYLKEVNTYLQEIVRQIKTN